MDQEQRLWQRWRVSNGEFDPRIRRRRILGVLVRRGDSTGLQPPIRFYSVSGAVLLKTFDQPGGFVNSIAFSLDDSVFAFIPTDRHGKWKRGQGARGQDSTV